MKEVILDTDVFSYLRAGRPELVRFEHHLAGRSGLLAFPSVAELHFGAHRRGWGPARLRRLEADLTQFPVLPPTEGLLRRWGRVKADAVRLGHPLGHQVHANDLWIAACALHYELPLLTGNERHYAGLPGLELLGPRG